MEKRIYYHDTDAGGVVYYANYLKYLEEARTEFLVHKGLDLQLFCTKKFLYAVRKCSITYRSPARYGDTLICDARLNKITAAQLIFDQFIHDKQTKRLVVEAQVTLACLNKDFKAIPIPEDLKNQLL